MTIPNDFLVMSCRWMFLDDAELAQCMGQIRPNHLDFLDVEQVKSLGLTDFFGCLLDVKQSSTF